VTVGGRGRGLRKGVPHQEVRVRKGREGARKGREGARVVPGPVTQVTRGLARGSLGLSGGAGGVLGAGAARQQWSLREGTRKEGPSKPGGERRGDPPPPFIAHRLVPSPVCGCCSSGGGGGGGTQEQSRGWPRMRLERTETAGRCGRQTAGWHGNAGARRTRGWCWVRRTIRRRSPPPWPLLKATREPLKEGLRRYAQDTGSPQEGTGRRQTGI